MRVMTVLMLLILSFGYAEETSWSRSVGQFSVEINLSTKQLPLDELLSIQMILKYPSAYRPNIGLMKSHLLSYEGLGEPPFALAREPTVISTITSNENTEQHIEFILIPKLPGKYSLTFQDIVFDPIEKNSSSPISFITEIFEMTISMPTIEFEPNAFIAPLMPLSQKPFVTMDYINRHDYIDNPILLKQERLRNRTIIESKTLPWLSVIAALLVSIAILLVKRLPQTIPIAKGVPLPSIDPKLEALKKLEILENEKLVEKGFFQTYFTKLDHTIRSFIDAKYQLDAITSTTQEFLKKTATFPDIKAETRSRLIYLLQSADRVKFAHHEPTQQECIDAGQAARDLIQDNTL